MLDVTPAVTMHSGGPNFPSICYITTAVYTLRANVLRRPQEPLSFLGMVFEKELPFALPTSLLISF